jgi:hypothetical protein
MTEIHLGRGELKKGEIAATKALSLCTLASERVAVLRALQRIAQATKNTALEKTVCFFQLCVDIHHVPQVKAQLRALRD